MQVSRFSGRSSDPIALIQNDFATPKVDVSWCDVIDTLVIVQMIVVIDEGGDLGFEVTRQEVTFQQDAVLLCLLPAFDLALGLGVID